MNLNARLEKLERQNESLQPVWWDGIELVAAEAEGREAAPGAAERVNMAITSGRLRWLEDLMA